MSSCLFARSSPMVQSWLQQPWLGEKDDAKRVLLTKSYMAVKSITERVK
jgi:hypothetical protein